MKISLKISFLVLFFCSVSFASEIVSGIYPVKLLNVVDGDTFDLEIKIWENQTLIKRIRLLNIDTPELKPKIGTEQEKIVEKERALKAKKYVEDILKDKQLFFWFSWKSDNFGRALGTILWINNGNKEDIREHLKKDGHTKSTTQG
jgi:endonuclease YncB( thermonuclease family)